MIEEGLYTRLVAEVASVSGRVYPVGESPQNPTYPYLTYQCVSDPAGQDHGGVDTTVDARYTVTSFAQEYGTMKATAAEVRTAIEAFSGAMDDVTVAAVFHEGGTDLIDPEMKPTVHYRPDDFRILYTR